MRRKAAALFPVCLYLAILSRTISWAYYVANIFRSLRIIALTALRTHDSISSMNDKNMVSFARESEDDPDRTRESDEELAMLAKALAHPARVQILRILAMRPGCVCGDIVSQLPLAQSTVSEHLRILKAAGLIDGEVDGPRVCYCLDVSAFDRFRSLVRDFPRPIDLSQQTKSEVD